jgi:low temperature requirement protein LtrA
VLRLAPWTLSGATLILVAGFAAGARIWLWVAALACAYVGPVLSGSTGWQLHPSHFAERYGLVLIIALGEAFISIGIGATGIGIGLGEVVAAILGLLVATSFWLAYFDFFSIRGEQILRDRQGVERVALCGGSALYLLTYSVIRIRVERRVRVSRGRFVAALVFFLVLPLATAVPALAALGIVTAVWVALHTYELVWWREARAESRSMLASP